jgi:DMSO/TMAO reductase YedYZ molybdopterin-dependent catalytic subunit
MKNNGRIWLLVSVILLSVILLPACQFASVGPELGSPTVQAPPEEPAVDLSYLVHMDPAEVDNSELPVTSVEELHRTGVVPEGVDIKQYRLIMDGLVENPLTLTYQDILTYPTVIKVVLLICYNFFADNAEWTGVPVKTLLDEAEVKPEATKVIFYGMDGYQSSISLETAQESGVFLAHTVNGQILPLEHGYPLRLVVEHDFGSEWVKWVSHIEVR